MREFIETNDIIEKDVAKRKSKNDKSFETYGKHIEILLKKNPLQKYLSSNLPSVCITFEIEPFR